MGVKIEWLKNLFSKKKTIKWYRKRIDPFYLGYLDYRQYNNKDWIISLYTYLQMNTIPDREYSVEQKAAFFREWQETLINEGMFV